MRVQRVLMPGSVAESWTLLGEDHEPVEPVERFLAFLASIERSPNTVKAYAHDLKDWFAFLNQRGLDWRAVTLEDVAGYVAWLRPSPPLPGPRTSSPHHHRPVSTTRPRDRTPPRRRPKPPHGPQTHPLNSRRPRLRNPAGQHAHPLPRPRHHHHHHSRRGIDNFLSIGVPQAPRRDRSPDRSLDHSDRPQPLDGPR
jgi:hypothetical protein